MFEIISFGTEYEFLSNDKKGFIYNDKNLEFAKEEIDDFYANLGGTDIDTPLKKAFKIKTKKEYQKRIFLLTDGEVGNPDKVIEIAKSNNENGRVYTFGVGSDCSKYLVKEVARAGRGSYSFIEEDENLNVKVINALKNST